MTADIITFPNAKRRPGEGPIVWRGKTVHETLAMALHWDELGLTLQDIPADTSPNIRRIIEILLDPASWRDPDGDTVA
jgi:hypothetical protein